MVSNPYHPHQKLCQQIPSNNPNYKNNNPPRSSWISFKLKYLLPRLLPTCLTLVIAQVLETPYVNMLQTKLRIYPHLLGS